MTARFGLRGVFLIVTAVCLLLGLGVTLSPAWSAALGMFSVLATAHVAGNVIGTRLRELAPPPMSAQPVMPPRRGPE
jgi:hypothetical protein